MIVKASLSPENFQSAVKRVSELGIEFTTEHAPASSDYIFHFSAPVDEATVKAKIWLGVQDDRLKNVADYDSLNIRSMAPAQVDAYIDANCASLADAKRILKILAKLNLYYLKRLQDVN